MAAVAVEVPVGGGDAAVGEEDGDLVEGLGALRPEVPLHVHVAEVGPGVPLLGVDEHLELVWIADEEDGRVVSDEVPVALVGVELDGEPADVAGVGSRPRSPATVEKRRKASVLRPILRTSCAGGRVMPVTVKVPYAAALGVDDASGMRSRLKCCICSMRATSCMSRPARPGGERLLHADQRRWRGQPRAGGLAGRAVGAHVASLDCEAWRRERAAGWIGRPRPDGRGRPSTGAPHGRPMRTPRRPHPLVAGPARRCADHWEQLRTPV